MEKYITTNNIPVKKSMSKFFGQLKTQVMSLKTEPDFPLQMFDNNEVILKKILTDFNGIV